jgi:short-subunit dehydrogenase
MISPFDDLRGRTALITGASSGIGRQIAIDLSRFGVKCVITGRNEEQLNVTSKLMHDEPQCVVADLTVEDSLASLVAQVDGLNILIHSAGTLAIAPVRQITESLMRSCVELNLMAPMTLTGKLLRAGKIEKGGSIVFLSSVGASVGIAGNAIYSAT